MKVAIKYLKEFKIDVSDLTQSEKKTLAKLLEAARLIGKIYAKQINDKYPGANFYPHDVTKDEIEQAAHKNPEILNPYTVIERKNGKLTTTAYHLKYRNQLLPIAKLIKEAAEITDNKHFAHRLKLQADALLDGAYEAADIYWLTMKPYKIDIVIGPIERYEDRLFFVKTAYQAWVGIINEAMTKKLNFFKEVILSPVRKVVTTNIIPRAWGKIQLRTDKTLLFSGLIARFVFTSTSLPNNPDLIAKHGAEITIFEQPLELLFKTRHHPIFHAVFDKKFVTSYPQDLLKQGAFMNAFVHEIGRQLLQYKDAEERLKELYPVIDEIASTLLGIKSTGSLLLKGIISQKELEAILIIFFCRAFDWWEKLEKEPKVASYVKGNAIVLNFLISSGALKQSSGLSWPNFTKIYIGVSDLADVLERILAQGSYLDTRHFIETYGSNEIFKQFAPKVSWWLKHPH